VICAAASWRLGEEDSKAWSIVESKFPYERNFQISDNNSSNSPLPHAVFNILQAAKHCTKFVSIRFIDQAGLQLEQSMVYYHCKEQSSQQVLVSY
jgi:sterol regulatory element-binding transcription factor 1